MIFRLYPDLLNAALILVFTLLFAPQAALGAFTDSITIGNAKALSLGHAVTADPPDIDSVHFNPAGLARLKGKQTFIKGIAGIFSTEYEFGEYDEYQQNLIDFAAKNYRDENGNLSEEGKTYLYDEAYNSRSEVEGPTVMLPGGMVDLPAALGIMGGASYNPPGSRVTFATNAYAPMMNGLHRSNTDPGRYAQQRVAFTLITYLSPSIAYEVSNELSLGASINFNYSGMGMQLPIREPHLAIFYLGSPFIQENLCPGGEAAVDQLDVCTTIPPYTEYAELNFEADQLFVPGFNMGLLWSPTPWFTLGLSYNSAIKVDMEGEFQFPIRDTFKTFLVGLQDSDLWENLVKATKPLGIDLPTAAAIEKDAEGPIEISYEIPQRINTGISIQVTPSWKYNFDVRWTEWSAFSNINLDFGVDVPLLMWGTLADLVGTGGSNGLSSNSVKYQLGLQDVTYWGTGVEYQYNDRLALRAGFETRPSAVPKDAPNAFIPINDGNLYSLGFAYELDAYRHIDFGTAYFSSKTHYPPCSAKLGNSCDPNDVVYNPYAGQDIKTEVTYLLFEINYREKF